MPKPLQTLFALSIVILITTCYADNNSSNTSSTTTLCAPSHCGNISIHYPFWLRSQHTEFCGYPDFGLECSEGKAIINLPSDTYYVTDINYETHSITLVDIDILNQQCPRARHNVSLTNNIPLSFSSLDLNLSFYFNCSSKYPSSSVDPIGCWKISGDNRESYVFVAGDEGDLGSDDLHCEEHVVVTVKDDEIDIGGGGLINGFGDAMKKGFVLDWRRAADCAQCEVSGGYCGYDQNTKQSTCICGNGSVVAKSCTKGTLSFTCLKVFRLFFYFLQS